jgi:Universal stress protein family
MSGERTGQELVVVGVDSSATSVRALGWAARYAAATGARVKALLAWHYPDAAGQAPVGVAPEPVRHEAEARMRATWPRRWPGPGPDGRAPRWRPGSGMVTRRRS